MLEYVKSGAVLIISKVIFKGMICNFIMVEIYMMRKKNGF